MDAESPAPIRVAGPLYTADETWFCYYGYIDWRAMLDVLVAPTVLPPVDLPPKAAPLDA